MHRQDLVIAAGVFLLAAGVYVNSVGHGFVWDDVPVIPENPFLASSGAWWRCFGRDFGLEIIRQPAGYYRPLVFVSFWLNYVAGGIEPCVYHLTNVLLHGINAVLVFALLARLTGRLAGALGATVFAVHPVHAESIAFIAGRSDLLCALFLLATLLAAIRAFETRGRRRWAWQTVAALSYLAALLSKELAVALPALLLAYGLIHRYRARSLMRLCAPAAALAIAYLAFRLRFFPMAGSKGLMPMEGTFIERLARLFFLYAAQQTFPVAPTLGADVLARSAWVDAIAVALLAAVIGSARPRRRAADACAWLILFLGPTLWVNLFKAIELSDRFAYVPSVGISALAGLAAARYWRRAPLSRAVVALVVVVFAALGHSYGRMWRDEISLWAASVRYHPRCGRCYFNLGNAYRKTNDATMAVRSFYAAARLLPDEERRCWAYANLARTLAETGETTMAIEACRSAVRLRPKRAGQRQFFAALFSEIGKHDAAVAELKVAAALSPESAEIHLDLAREYLALSPPPLESARQAYDRARQLGAPSDREIEQRLE